MQRGRRRQARATRGGVREFLEAKHHAERRLTRFGVPWSVLRFGRPTEDLGNAAPRDSDVEWVGDGPVPAEPVGNEDPAPGIP